MVLKIVLLHRFIPHYRSRPFHKLHVDHGWRIVSSASRGKSLGIALSDTDDWVERENMILLRGGRVAILLLRKVLSRMRGTDILVSEFSLNISWCYEMAIRACVPARFRRTLYIFYSHGFTKGEINNGGAKFFLKRWMFNRVDGVICYTPEAASLLRRTSAQTNIYSVRNTIDLAGVNLSLEQGRDADHEKNGCLRAVISNRLVENKNVDIAIKAIADCKKNLESDDIALTVIGDGPLRAELEDLSHSIGANVTFVGEVYDIEKLSALFSECDVAVIPGAAGLFVNQALAFGLPVVLFDQVNARGHHPEEAYVVDGVNGIRIPGFPDAHRLAEVFFSLASNAPRLDRMSRGAKAYSEQNLGIEQWLHGMHAACEDVFNVTRSLK